MPSWRGLARCIALVILLNTGLDLCTCDLLEGLFPGAAAQFKCCDHCEACVCCAPTLVTRTAPIQLSLAISDGPISLTPTLANPEPTGIEHPPKALAAAL